MSATRYGEWHEKLGGFETHAAALGWIPRDARVLDVGCASGYFARRLIDEKGCRVVGIEMDPGAAARARETCERVHVGSLEDRAFLDGVDETADVVFFGDVLEHLADARPVLERARGWLAPGGAAICSIPNVAYWKIRLELFRGRFEYQDVGILDRTHLRFFTRASFERVLGESGYRVLEALPVCSDRSPLGFQTDGGAPSRAGALLARRLPGLFATQFLFRAVPGQPGPGAGA
ncbi:MAG: class I SAM-dependent methyltransferase [Deltaproteobacteria bacterium]|nr:class I SAM-dependent methyltransferase [Deltaproteobacteria bacterium]